jgi:hypothetical protein
MIDTQSIIRGTRDGAVEVSAPEALPVTQYGEGRPYQDFLAILSEYHEDVSSVITLYIDALIVGHNRSDELHSGRNSQPA